MLTQEWVNGRKLTDITADPTTGPLRAKLVQTLLNSYMVQFLETGFLHADPHPGNFMLMPDGRLCILDYGMMTTISEDQRVAFIEYIAHLSARDYDKTLQDLVNLGFVPPELANDPVNRAIVVPVLVGPPSVFHTIHLIHSLRFEAYNRDVHIDRCIRLRFLRRGGL